MATEFGKRLKKARAHAGLTQEAASKITSISQSSISTAEREGHGSTDTAIYAKTYGVDAYWLATGKGDMLPEIGNVSEPSKIKGSVPILSSVQAGAFKELLENQHDDMEHIQTSVPVNAHTFALRVSGDSMEPDFVAGMILIVEPDLDAQPNDFVIAKNGGDETTFKQLIKDGGDWYLKPLNSRYPIKPLGHSAIIGVVRSVERKFR